MTQRTLQNRISQLKQLEVLQAEIKQEMKNRGTDETTVGNWIVRFKAVASNKFSSKQFKADHPLGIASVGKPAPFHNDSRLGRQQNRVEVFLIKRSDLMMQL